MDKRTIILVVVLFGLIVLGMFTFAYLKKVEISEGPKVSAPAPLPQDTYSDITRITAKHFIQNGKHTFVGDIEMPTPCDLVDVNSTVNKSLPEEIILNFKVINNSNDCEQMITSQRFVVEAQASPEAKVSAMFMGRAVELNLIPAAKGESPEEFELFIKG